jgi:uncharacterized membrane protein
VLFRRAYLTGAIVWAGVIPLVALAASSSNGASAGYVFAIGVYALGHVICHQLPVRSFHLWGAALPVCARCTGIYAGAAMTALLISIRPVHTTPSAARARRLLIAALFPTALTLAYEWMTGAMPANWIRAFAGVPLGTAVIWLLGTVDVELRNAKRKTQNGERQNL